MQVTQIFFLLNCYGLRTRDKVPSTDEQPAKAVEEHKADLCDSPVVMADGSHSSQTTWPGSRRAGFLSGERARAGAVLFSCSPAPRLASFLAPALVREQHPFEPAAPVQKHRGLPIAFNGFAQCLGLQPHLGQSRQKLLSMGQISHRLNSAQAMRA